TTYHFEYGIDTSYGSVTPDTGAGSGTTDVSASAGIIALSPVTEYHFRIVAVNANGTTYGLDQTFTTGSAARLIWDNSTFDSANWD
ncbi:MAG: hypothetical protein SVY10_14255, partial [Thermodesulfobacteriota bacterium]|nr:hypothetical protein [Thermodesulfobacteriota bacterium]